MTTNAERCREYYYRHRAERVAHQKAYYRAHREERLEYARDYGVKNSPMLREKALLYRERNIDRIREHDRQRGHTDERRKRTMESYWRNRPGIRARSALARKAMLAEAKALFGNRCAMCGYSERVDALEFDHVVPPVKTGRSRVSSDRNVAALVFPEKFMLLCPNCHAIKTKLWQRAYPPSGSALKQRRARSNLVREFGGMCRLCGYNECEMALQFDHIVPIRSSYRNGQLVEVRAHPERFQLLCATCHEIKTINDRESWRGTKSAQAS